MPLLECRVLKIHSFPHFSLTRFDILSWNFAFHFVLLYYRSSSSVVNFPQFLLELYPFWNLEYYKYTVFRFFLLHALTNWAEILHIILFYCTTDQVRVSSIFVWVMPLLELRILKIHSFPHFSLTRFEILSWNFAYYFVLLYYRSSSSVIILCPSGSLSVHQFSALSSYMHRLFSWKLKFDVHFVSLMHFFQKSII